MKFLDKLCCNNYKEYMTILEKYKISNDDILLDKLDIIWKRSNILERFLINRKYKNEDSILDLNLK